jgi:RimJ/RimL family protein N-acetyltransferase
MTGDVALDEDAFLRTVLAALPADVGPVSLSTRFADLPQDKVARAALRQGLSTTLGHPPRDLLDSIDSLQEAYDWYTTRAPSAGDGGSGRAAPRMLLRPVETTDLPDIYRAATDPEHSFRWRYRGSTPSFAQFSSQLFEGVLAQFMVVDHDGRTHGLVCGYNAHLDSKFAYIAFLRTGPSQGAGEMMVGVTLLIDHLFSNWDFRKLYAEVPEFNAAGMFSEDSRAVRVEGRLVGHMFHAGRWWDQLIVALWREDWVQESASWVDGATGV